MMSSRCKLVNQKYPRVDYSVSVLVYIENNFSTFGENDNISQNMSLITHPVLYNEGFCHLLG